MRYLRVCSLNNKCSSIPFPIPFRLNIDFPLVFHFSLIFSAFIFIPPIFHPCSLVSPLPPFNHIAIYLPSTLSRHSVAISNSEFKRNDPIFAEFLVWSPNNTRQYWSLWRSWRLRVSCACSTLTSACNCGVHKWVMLRKLDKIFFWNFTFEGPCIVR